MIQNDDNCKTNVYVDTIYDEMTLISISFLGFGYT